MIGLDTNVIIHCLVASQREHPSIRAWFDKNEEPLGTTTTNIAEVLRLLTHPRVFPRPLSIGAAVDLIQDFLAAYQVEVLEEAETWWLDLKKLKIPSLRGNEIFDARIALCLRYHGIKTLFTLDTDFSKYPFLKVLTL